MAKYIGIVQINEESMSGLNITFKYRTFHDKEKRLIRKWFSLYPVGNNGRTETKHVLLPYTKDLADMFSIYRDYTPLTKEEEIQEERIKKRVELMLHSEELYEQVHTGKITLEEAYTQYKASNRARVRKNSDL